MLSADFILFSQIIIPSISIHVKLCARVQEWEKMYFNNSVYILYTQ